MGPSGLPGEVLQWNSTHSARINVMRGTWSSDALPFADLGQLVVLEGGLAAVGRSQISIFDGRRGTWGPVVDSALLPSFAVNAGGRVFMGGGPNAWGVVPCQSIFDPASNSLQRSPGFSQTAVVEAGFVIVQYETASMLLELDTNRWSALPSRLEGPLIPLGNGRVLVAGRTPALFDVRTQGLTPVPSNDAIVPHRFARLHDGRVFLLSMPSEGAQARIYDPATGIWSALDSLPLPVSEPALTVIDGGKLMVSGGKLADGTETSIVQFFDLAVGRWSGGDPMPEPRAGHTSHSISSGRFVFSRSRWGVPLLFYTTTTTWGSLSGPGSHSGQLFPTVAMTTLPNDRLLTIDEPEECICLTSRWTHVFDLTTGTDSAEVSRRGRRGVTLVPLPDGRVMQLGGVGRDAAFVEFWKE